MLLLKIGYAYINVKNIVSIRTPFWISDKVLQEEVSNIRTVDGCDYIAKIKAKDLLVKINENLDTNCNVVIIELEVDK